MNKEQAKGYLLEIVLSKLIEVNGYEVINEQNFKNFNIGREGEIKKLRNGLNVKGRGGYHQFDTLGTFKVTPPFVYPLRLFVEAKFYSPDRQVGIDRVRVGVGILNDVNTNYSTVNMTSEQLSIARYHYHYALFSTSGFSAAAQRYAIAYRIQLIDLSGTEYKPIIKLIDNIVKNIPVKIKNNKPTKVLDVDFKEFKELFRDSIYSNDITSEFSSLLQQYDETLKENIFLLVRIIRGQYLYLASTNSGHIIPLLTSDAFNEVLVSNAHQKVAIKWKTSKPNRWIIIPDDNRDIRITFELPKLLDKFMRLEGRLEHNSRNIKENIIKKMAFIAYLDSENPILCTLTYDQELTDEITLDEDDE